MKHGFTLAEVLITLMIIGIVAALTIPSVISNAQQQEFKTGLKKAVSVLNEAIQTNIALEGITPLEADDIFEYFSKHMSIIKSGAYSDVTRQFGYNKVMYTTDGMRFEFDNWQSYKNMFLHESGINIRDIGTFAKPTQWGSNASPSWGHCGSYGLSENKNHTKYVPCVVLVDINGDKKPNPPENFNEKEYGNWEKGYYYPSPTDKKLTDVFNIMITDEKAIPFGVVAQRAMYSK